MSPAAASTILARVRSPLAVSLGRSRVSLPTTSRSQLSGFDNPFRVRQNGCCTPLSVRKRLDRILGTTAGKVGSETARLLRERDVPVRVLVRDPAQATARALAEAGAEIITGDLGVPA